MKREIFVICLLVSVVGIATVLYLLGLTEESFVIAAIFLLCPVLVGVQLFRGVRQFDKDMAEVERQLKRKNLPEFATHWTRKPMLQLAMLTPTIAPAKLEVALRHDLTPVPSKECHHEPSALAPEPRTGHQLVLFRFSGHRGLFPVHRA